MRLAISLSPADLAGEEGLLGLAVENLFWSPTGSGEGCVMPELVALALLDEPTQLGIVIGEEVEWAPPFLPHEEKRSGWLSEQECGGGLVIAGSS